MQNKPAIVSLSVVLLLLVAVGLWFKFSIKTDAILEPKYAGASTHSTTGIPKLSQRQLAFLKRDTAGEATLTKATMQFLTELESDFSTNTDRLRDYIASRCESDPHLTKALGDHWSTPLLSATPRTSRENAPARAALREILMQDYQMHGLDNDETRALVSNQLPIALESSSRPSKDNWSVELQKISADSKDPYLAYWDLMCITAQEELRSGIRRAHNALNARSVSPHLTILIEAELCSRDEWFSEEEKSEACVRLVDAYLEYASASNNDAPGVKRLLFEEFYVFGSGLNVHGLIEIARSISEKHDKTCPKWLKHCVAGKICDGVASKHRGTLFINKVPEEDLQLFQKYAEKHSQHFLYTLLNGHDIPQILRQLLRAEYRSGSTGGSIEFWFRLALATRSDLPGLIDAYSTGCDVRWGGSETKLFWLADKLADCAGSSDIDWAMFCYPIQLHCRDESYTVDLDRPELVSISNKVLKYLKSTEKDNRCERIPKNTARLMCKLLWDTCNYSQLAWFIDQNADEISSTELATHRLSLPLLKAIAQTASIENEGIWRKICKALFYHSEDITIDELRTLDALLESIRPRLESESSRYAYRTCHQLLGWLIAFHEGEMVELHFDDDAAAWTSTRPIRVTGNGRVEFECVTGDRNFTLAPLVHFPLPHRFEADFANLGGAADYYGMAIQTGASSLIDSGVELRSILSKNIVLMDRHPDSKGIGKALSYYTNALGGVHTLGIEQYRDHGFAFFNEKRIGSWTDTFHTRGIIQIGRDGPWHHNSARYDATIKYQISNVFIEKL
jgi:hypothetical protein